MSETNELQQSLLDAMDLIGGKVAKSTKAPMTIKAEILELLDEGTHQYKISYGGAKYSDAYSISNAAYEPETMVFVLIPDNDFDNPKIILNAVDPASSSYADDELVDMRIPISDNLVADNTQFDLKSWEDGEGSSEDGSLYPIVNLPYQFSTMFKDYTNKYKTFLFSTKLKTEIAKDYQSKGNYGLKLRLPFLQKDSSTSEGSIPITKDFVMDVTNILGNPYDYNVFQEVDLYFEIDDTLTYDDSRFEEAQIIPFTRDFGYIDKPKDKESDIHFRDISIKMIDVVPAEQVKGYYLTVVSDSGHYFLNEVKNEKKVLTPILKVNGKTTRFTDFDCYWFVEDASINPSSEDYVSSGGLGWKCLNTKTNVTTDDTGKPTFDYIKNQYSFEVYSEDVVSELRYKCLLIKKDIKVSGIIKLKDLHKPIELSLESKTGNTKYIENVGNVELIAKLDDPDNIEGIKKKSYYVKWQRFDKNGNYIDNDFFNIEIVDTTQVNHYELAISFPVSKVEKVNTITCSFYQIYQDETETDPNLKTKEQIIGTKSLVVTTVSGVNYIVNISGGDRLYKYDPEGDSPMEPTYDGPASSGVTACDPLNFNIFKADGTELTDNEYLYCTFEWKFPKTNTLLKLKSPIKPEEGVSQDDEYYYISGRGHNTNIQYTISPTYYKNKNNNDIYLSVQVGDETINTFTSIIFTKDGMGGTNGSKYTAEIRHKGYAYGQIINEIPQKLQCLYEAPNEDVGGWYGYDGYKRDEELVWPFNNPEMFTIAVYKDASLVTEDKYTVTWSMFDPAMTSSLFDMRNGNPDIGQNQKNGYLSASRNWEIKEDDEVTGICNIIQATVVIPDTPDEDSTSDQYSDGVSNIDEVIYVYYPIEITRIGKRLDIDKNIIPTLNGGFEEVLYSSDGTNPDWNKESSFTCVNNIYNSNPDLEYTWTTSSNLHKEPLKEGDNPAQAKISPIAKFEHNITNNYVRVDLKMSSAKREKLNTNLETLNKNLDEKDDEKEKINDLKEAVLDMVEKIGYNKGIIEDESGEIKEIVDLNTCLKNCTNLLKYRFQLLTILNTLKEEEIEKAYRFRDRYNMYEIIGSIGNKRTKIEEQYNKIYFLTSSDDITEMTEDMKFKEYTPDRNNKYHDYSYSYNRFIDFWNSYIDKYNDIVKEAKQVKKDEFNCLNILRTSLPITVEYVMENILDKSNETQFVNLYALLKQNANKLSTIKGRVLSYTDIENILKSMKSSIDIYSINPSFDKDKKLENTDYTKKIYDTQISSLEKEIANLEKQINEIKSELTLEVNSALIHVKPILMHMNNTEMSYLRGWDGHKLYTGEKDNGEAYLFAPQVGAGQKNKDGQFTGMVMGIKKFNKNKENLIGMFGMYNSIQTMFLNAEDGSAIFGSSGSGQIIIDPSENRGLLYSANYFNENDYKGSTDGKPNSYSTIGNGTYHTNGILINFVGNRTNDEPLNPTKTDGKPYIHFGSSNGYIYSGTHNTLPSLNDGFYLDHKGLSIGNSIRISATDKNGLVEVGKLNGNHWKIAGAIDGSNSYIGYNADTLGFTWGTIPEIKGNSNSVYIGTDGIRLGNKFAVNNSGQLYAKEGYLDGEIHAKKGSIGDWTIDAGSIRGPKIKNGKKVPYVVLTPDGDITVQGNDTPKWQSWHLYTNGKMTVDTPGSHFGPAYIADDSDAPGEKGSYLNSQWSDISTGSNSGAFRGSFHEEILKYIEDKAPAKGIPYRVTYHPATSSTEEYWDVTF